MNRTVNDHDRHFAPIRRRTLLALSALPLIGMPARAAPVLKAGFVYPGPARDSGASASHDLARQAVEQAVGARVKTTVVENVPEGAAAEPVIRKLAASGHKLIFATAYGYMSPTEKVARDFPKVIFEQAYGNREEDNLGNYEARMHEGAYLMGVLAARMTRSNILGMVGAVPLPDVIRNINAFALGAQSVNPKIRTRVVWAHTRYDPVKERQAAENLLSQGVDVLGQTTESPAPLQAAQQRGRYALGWGSDMARFAPRAHLTATISDWSEFYVKTAQAVLNGAWRRRDFDGGLKQDMVRLAPLNRAVPPDVAALIEERRKMLLSYHIRVFAGPLRDQDGHVRVSINANLRARELMGMNWFVHGVDGAIPR